MVIGGQAVLVYGEPRLTRDIDVTLGVGVDDLGKVKSAVEGLDLSFLNDDEKFIRKTMVLPLRNDTSGIRIDLIFSFSPYERQAIENANEIMIDGALVRFASLEDVVIHKIFAGRPRDLEDVRSILLKNPKYDKTYILKWLKEFDSALDGNFTSTFQTILSDIIA